MANIKGTLKIGPVKPSLIRLVVMALFHHYFLGRERKESKKEREYKVDKNMKEVMKVFVMSKNQGAH